MLICISQKQLDNGLVFSALSLSSITIALKVFPEAVCRMFVHVDAKPHSQASKAQGWRRRGRTMGAGSGALPFF